MKKNKEPLTTRSFLHNPEHPVNTLADLKAAHAAGHIKFFDEMTAAEKAEAWRRVELSFARSYAARIGGELVLDAQSRTAEIVFTAPAPLS